jgi:hypothetical protein
MFVNPSSLTYTGDGGSGTVDPNLAAYIGTSQPVSLDIQDHGTDPLTINSVKIEGSGDFQLQQPSPADVDGGKISTLNPYPTNPAHALVTFYFAPSKVGPQTATVVITSNATLDGGVVSIPITALGVTPDAGQFDDADGG